MPAETSEYWAALVPELLVTDLDRSLAFYVDLCGFRIRISRPEDGFAYSVSILP
jgi:catechol 2,3-dioxygenase-like lactoylglutathione lyase family enzyme